MAVVRGPFLAAARRWNGRIAGLTLEDSHIPHTTHTSTRSRRNLLLAPLHLTSCGADARLLGIVRHPIAVLRRLSRPHVGRTISGSGRGSSNTNHRTTPRGTLLSGHFPS